MRMAGNCGDRFRCDAELRGRSGCASHGHVGMRPGMVADFVAFGDALDERGVSCDPNHRRRLAATRFE